MYRHADEAIATTLRPGCSTTRTTQPQDIDRLASVAFDRRFCKEELSDSQDGVVYRCFFRKRATINVSIRCSWAYGTLPARDPYLYVRQVTTNP